MMSPVDFAYALENTKVIVEPRRAIETFGQTSFRFHLITEPMDEVGTTRVRTGQIHAERPRIMAPHYINRILLEGFGEQAEEIMELFEKYPEQFKILRYGFVFKKTDVATTDISQSKEKVMERLQQEILSGEDPTAVLIEGVDEGWEACLIKFTMDLIGRSAGENVGEWKKRGLIR